MKTSIRFARPSEVPLAHSFEYDVPLPRLKQMIHNKEIMFAFCRKKPVGYLRFQCFWMRIPYLALILIKPAYRKKGIGRSLLAFLERHLLALGFSKLLSSSTATEPGAQNWHRKVGFTEAGFIAGINSHDIGEVFFIKNLD